MASHCFVASGQEHWWLALVDGLASHQHWVANPEISAGVCVSCVMLYYLLSSRGMTCFGFLGHCTRDPDVPLHVKHWNCLFSMEWKEGMGMSVMVWLNRLGLLWQANLVGIGIGSLFCCIAGSVDLSGHCYRNCVGSGKWALSGIEESVKRPSCCHQHYNFPLWLMSVWSWPLTQQIHLKLDSVDCKWHTQCDIP